MRKMQNMKQGWSYTSSLSRCYIHLHCLTLEANKGKHHKYKGSVFPPQFYLINQLFIHEIIPILNKVLFLFPSIKTLHLKMNPYMAGVFLHLLHLQQALVGTIVHILLKILEGFAQHISVILRTDWALQKRTEEIWMSAEKSLTSQHLIWDYKLNDFFFSLFWNCF